MESQVAQMYEWRSTSSSDVACLHLFCFARFSYFDGAHQRRCGLLAQLVEHRIPDPKAGGSSPP